MTGALSLSPQEGRKPRRVGSDRAGPSGGHTLIHGGHRPTHSLDDEILQGGLTAANGYTPRRQLQRVGWKEIRGPVGQEGTGEAAPSSECSLYSW